MSNEKRYKISLYIINVILEVFYIYGEDFIIYYLLRSHVAIIFKIGNFFKSLFEIWTFVFIIIF